MGMIFLNKKNIKKIFLFVTLIILFIGLVSATDIESNDTTNQINEKTVEDTIDIETKTADNSINTNEEDNLVKKEYDPIESTIETKLNIDEIDTTEYLKNISIHGNCSDINGNSLKNVPLTLNINGKNLNTNTDVNGIFNYSYRTNIIGKNNISISFNGNNQYASSTKNTTFEVISKTTKITINPISQSEYLENITITGKYNDIDGNILRWTPLFVNINGKNYTTRTNELGQFTFKYTTNKIGTNNVKIYYLGNERYAATETNTTFTVTSKTTKITVNNIPTVHYSENISITGKYNDIDGNILRWTPLNLNINGINYYTRTNEVGDFTFKYRTNKIGTNNVSISFSGNIRYQSTTKNSSFNVIKQSTKLNVENIKDVQYLDAVEITGKFIDKNNISLKLTPIIVNVNGKKYTPKTDEEGIYRFEYKAYNLGNHTVSVTYYGNDKYDGANDSTSFFVSKKDTVITLNKIPNSTLGNKIQIKGKYTDIKGNPLKQTTLTLLINDQRYYSKTDENGNFSCDYETYVFDENTLEIYYNDTDKYKGTSLKTTFYVDADESGKIFKTRKTPVASVFVSGTVTNEHVKKWVNSGITDVYVRVKQSTNDTKTLRNTIDLCKKTNIKVHAWVIVFRDSGKWSYTVSTQNKMKKFISDVMHIQGVEGICLDYIRYSGLEPKIVNTSMVNNFVKDVNYMAKKYDKRMEISACVLPEIKNLVYYYGQDTRTLEKYCDYLILMAYKNNYYEDTAWMASTTKELIKQTKHAKVVTSLTTYSDLWGNKYLSVKEITNDIKAIMNAGSYGYSLFSKSTTPVYPKIF